MPGAGAPGYPYHKLILFAELGDVLIYVTNSEPDQRLLGRDAVAVPSTEVIVLV
jgi:hypothetical protein